MPRKPIDYKNCIIYHFVCHDKEITDTYVGHTTHFIERKASHKRACCNGNQKCNYKVYQNIRTNGGWENWQMIPLEKYPCESVIQARIREQYWMDTLQAKMNNNNAVLNEIEKKKSRKKYMKVYNKDYKEKHKQEIKQYYDDRKEERKEKYEINKEKIAEKAKITFTCTCESVCRITNKTRHLQSQKHINSMTTV